MARLYLFAEGRTEQTFASTVLQPHLGRHGVWLRNPVLIAHAKRRGVVHRGGGRRYGPMRDDILRFLKQDQDAGAFFTTMIDLYAIAEDFPGLADYRRSRGDSWARVETLEQAFSADLGDHRFLPYIQLHEFEALLFTDPAQFAVFYDDHQREIAALQGIADSVASPELINDGPLTAPSKRIIAHLPGYGSAKVSVGPQVAGLIGLERLRGQCPHFADWLGRLETLGTGAIP